MDRLGAWDHRWAGLGVWHPGGPVRVGTYL